MKTRSSILIVGVAAVLFAGFGMILAPRTISGRGEQPSSRQILANFAAHNTTNAMTLSTQSEGYTAQVLPAPSGAPGGATHAAALNNLGDVFGFVGPGNFTVPVVWNGGVPSFLPTVPTGYHLAAYGGGGPDNSFINDSGTIVSLAANDAVVAQHPNDGRRPVIWQNGSPTILPLPSDQICTDFAARYGITLDRANSWPMGLNGQSHVLVLACEAIWIWNGVSYQLLAQQTRQGTNPLSPSITSSGNHLNDLGHAVLDTFVSRDLNNNALFVPAIYSLGSNTPLAFTPQPSPASVGINNSDQVLASFHYSGTSNLQFWDGTHVVDLGQGGYSSLNNLGQVVFLGGSPHGPRIYKNGVISPLNIPGTSTATGAFLINDAGQIAANYFSSDTGTPYSVLYTPTNTPTPTPTPGDTAAPTLSLPSNITAEATGPAGAIVTYSVSATDDTDAHPSVVCAPASGSTFALGTTVVHCTATDASSNSASGSFNVTVVDTIGPVLTVPSNINIDATSSQGVAVSFSAMATDIVDAHPLVSCTPASGSTFAIDITTVQCTATDASGNSSQGSFTVTVNGASSQTANLIILVQSFNLAQGITNSLDAKLQNVLDAFSAANAGNRADACNQLAAFINGAAAQSGHQLTVAQANLLITKATQIMAVQACP